MMIGPWLARIGGRDAVERRQAFTLARLDEAIRETLGS